LKKEAHYRIVNPMLERQTALGLGVRAMSVARPHIARSIALGVAKQGEEDYLLAIRIQHPMLIGSDEVAALQKMAAGEADVRYVGAIRSQQSPAWLRSECRPLRIGCSVGHSLVTAGTLGAFVRLRNNNKDILILSNNHVLAFENAGKAGDDILQPGKQDGGTVPVATLTNFVPINYSANADNSVDCAIATLKSGFAADTTSLDSFGYLKGTRAARLEPNAVVRKIGRSSGTTTAKVLATEIDNVVVSYLTGDARFNGQIEVDGDDTPFSSDGDSGSLVIDEDNNGAALIFAGSEAGGAHGAGRSYAHPLDKVLEALDVSLLI
jgi:hypothetical protein